MGIFRRMLCICILCPTVLIIKAVPFQHMTITQYPERSFQKHFCCFKTDLESQALSIFQGKVHFCPGPFFNFLFIAVQY